MNASGTHTCGIKKSSIHKMWTRIYSLSNNNLNKPYPPKRLQILNSVSRLYEKLQMQNPQHKTIVFRDELLFMTTTLTIFWDGAETLFDDSSAYIYFQIYNDSWIDLCKVHSRSFIRHSWHILGIHSALRHHRSSPTENFCNLKIKDIKLKKT